MSDIEIPLILNLVLFLTVPFLGGLVASRLKLPRMIGYIVAGMIFGVIIQGESSTFLPMFANFGLILLLFTVGLELNINTVRRFGRLVIYLGLFQVGISWVLLVGLLKMFGFDFAEAAIMGFAFSLSSTALVSKFIQERGEESSLIGGMTMGILILQDIVVIPFMILLESAGRSLSAVEILMDISFSFARAGGILVMIYILAQRVIPVLLGKIAVISRELLNLFTILVIFACIALFSYLGLSPAIAAFVSGILIGGTLEHYQIFSQMRPLRDIFTILFFVFLGATIDIAHILPLIPKTLIFVLAVMGIKFFVVALLFIYFRFHSKTAFSTGVLLSQVGEFAFIVMHQSRETGFISQETYVFAIASTLLTIVLSPILMDHKDMLYVKIRKFVSKKIPVLDTYLSYRVDREPAHIDALSIKDHVIICGYGRVGSYIGRALTLAKIPFIAIDYSYQTVDAERKKGTNVIYGDPTDVDILDFAQVEYATALISAVPDAFSQEMIILNGKILNPAITILTRVGVEQDQRRMKDLGAEIVIQPEFEAALSIIRKILTGYNVSKEDIVGKIKRLKLEHGMV